MRDRADPHARERALLVARQDPPLGVSPDKAVAAVRDLLDTIGDTCPECPPKAGQTTFASARRDVPSPPSICRPISAMAR
jgi:hypothetical protein